MSVAAVLALATVPLWMMPVMVDAFRSTASSKPPFVSVTTSTTLAAIGALVKRAKKAALLEYVQSGVMDNHVREYCHYIKDTIDTIDLKHQQQHQSTGLIQQAITKRKGTLSVIAEYTRKVDNILLDQNTFAPEILSPLFREFGASAIAVLADERVGGCSYDIELYQFVKEQQRAASSIYGSIPVINNDIIIDEIQIARTKAIGANAIVLQMNLLGIDELLPLLKAAISLDLEVIVAVTTAEEAQQAIDAGARMISITTVAQDMMDVETSSSMKKQIIENLQLPQGVPITFIANIRGRPDSSLQEVEEAWACRDAGFHCAWVSDALFKAGTDPSEHPGAIIKAMKSKASLQWASPKARSGRGEGAREYLGDILM
jgi:indole-3-glycerol phosphate synthase